MLRRKRVEKKRSGLESAAGGGIGISFTDNSNTNWTTRDTDGQEMNNDSTENAWHYRTVDLTGFAGKTAVKLWIAASTATPVGSWDIYYGDIAIYSADGTVTAIYQREPGEGFSYWTGGGETNTQALVERSNTAADAELAGATTTYYVADQINSARMMLTAGGWPVSQDTYYPFGSEAYPPGDANHYKFSGKERDAESGNDDFGARYYSSAMGRFMSPDWSSKVEPVPYAKLDNPQSLNLYEYALNNPLSGVDKDGHSSDTGCGVNGAIIIPCSFNNETNNQPQAQQQNLSPAGLQFIEQHETVGGQPNLTAYDASGKKHLGDWTIGYGHKIKPGEDFSKGITADQAAGLLRGDVQAAVNAVNSALKYPTGSFQNEFDAMVSLAYNIGGTAFANSTLVQRWNSGGVVEQPDLFTRWSRTGGAFSPGLYARREDEFTLFNTGQY
ncbi:MAG: glycoside hydrolase family protein [Acidobacteriaceae bacterium]